jgi:hypothetical protein
MRCSCDWKRIFLTVNDLCPMNNVTKLNTGLSMMSKNYALEEIILRIFGQANPNFCEKVLNGGIDFWNSKRSMIKNLMLKRFEHTLHVFPVAALGAFDNAGIMAPIEILESDEWHVSDAFGKFGLENDRIKSPLNALMHIIEKIEAEWSLSNSGKVLPLRWRKALSIRLLCPFHIDMIEGDSLQVPLVIALLRTLALEPATRNSEATLPFGNCTVFATGTLQKNGDFGPINHLKEKAEGFLREYKEGMPAIITDTQETEFRKNDLIDKFKCYKANNLKELLELDEIKIALIKVCMPPHPSEIDGILRMMSHKQRRLQFGDIIKVCEWLLPQIESPFYRFKLLRQSGLNLNHEGQFTKAQKYFQEAQKILDSQREFIGISEEISLFAAMGTFAVDACATEILKPLMTRLEKDLPYASPDDLTRYWGTLCQVYQIDGEYNMAVDAGENSIRYADVAFASDAGRDRNYLIHALISRAKSFSDSRETDLERANHLLEESQGKWLPTDDTRARQSHLVYCLHFEAEIARLLNKPFTLPEYPPWSGVWGDPWMFALLSGARNILNATDERRRYAGKMVEFAKKRKPLNDEVSLYGLFFHVYKIFQAGLEGAEVRQPVYGLKKWITSVSKQGWPGWEKRLTPIVEKLEAKNINAIEDLCEAIHYH